MNYRPVISILIGIAAVISFLREWHRTDNFTVTESTSAVDPKIEFPSLISLGEQQAGSIASAKWTVHNSGGKPLLITNIQSTCSCSALEIPESGKWVAAKDLRLESGQSIDCQVRILITHEPGKTTTSTISFNTNDPNLRVGAFVIQVPRILGVTFQPGTLALGSLLRQSQTSHEADIINVGTIGVKLQSVESSDADLFTVELIPNAKPSGLVPYEGTFLGKVRVIPKTIKSGPIQGKVVATILREDLQTFSTSLIVQGLVVDPIRSSPGYLTFPRQSEVGPVYSGTCIVKAHNGQSFDLNWLEQQKDFKVNIETLSENPGSKLVQIEYLGTRAIKLDQVLRFQATQDKTTYPLTINIQIRE